MEYREDIAHIKLPDGRVFQVLNEAGDDWDEEATALLVEEYLKSKESSNLSD